MFETGLFLLVTPARARSGTDWTSILENIIKISPWDGRKHLPTQQGRATYPLFLSRIRLIWLDRRGLLDPFNGFSMLRDDMPAECGQERAQR